ncbi:MAG: hypothetical protein KDA32_11830 [Phycisphaerales bacterium]|nr:hypothetical protein [Phycisphaerales bacterium]
MWLLFLLFQLGALPPQFHMPREKEEWAKFDPGPIPVDDTYDENFPGMMSRLSALTEFVKSREVIDDSAVDRLLSELVHDDGHPLLNKGSGDFIVGLIGGVGRRAPNRFAEGARRRLAEGVAVYLRAGGGRGSPGDEADAALALMVFVDENEAYRAMADELLMDALSWATTVESKVFVDSVNKRCAQAWGDSFWIDAADAELPADFPADPPKAYWEAIEALRSLVAEPELDERNRLRLLRDASRRCQARFEDARLSDDLIARLLLAYRLVLRRSPEAPERLGAEIERDLVSLARKERLESDRLWDNWMRAATALGPNRVTDMTRRALEKLARDPDLNAKRQGDIAHLADLVRPAER